MASTCIICKVAMAVLMHVKAHASGLINVMGTPGLEVAIVTFGKVPNCGETMIKHGILVC